MNESKYFEQKPDAVEWCSEDGYYSVLIVPNGVGWKATRAPKPTTA
jgi:hypothetical protein